MAVIRAHGEYRVDCDTCGDACNEVGDNFQEAIDAFKEAGGRVYKDDEGDWAHACAVCRSM